MLNWLLAFVPVEIALEYLAPESHLLVFTAAAIAILPLAGWTGRATEQLADRSGEGVGGLSVSEATVGGNCGPSASASSRRGRGTTPRTRRRRRLSKKSPGARGGGPGRASRQAHRALVPGRGAGRAEEQAHPPVGSARHPAARAARPAHRLGLHLRRDLPGRGQGRRARHAVLRHAGDAGASRRDQRHGRPGRPCRPAPRPSRLASRRRARRPGQHHPPAAAAALARAEPGREHLAVPARQLALEPRLQRLRRHRRPLLRRLE